MRFVLELFMRALVEVTTLVEDIIVNIFVALVLWSPPAVPVRLGASPPQRIEEVFLTWPNPGGHSPILLLESEMSSRGRNGY
jgi:hypothetical protein